MRLGRQRNQMTNSSQTERKERKEDKIEKKRDSHDDDGAEAKGMDETRRKRCERTGMGRRNGGIVHEHEHGLQAVGGTMQHDLLQRGQAEVGARARGVWRSVQHKCKSEKTEVWKEGHIKDKSREGGRCSRGGSPEDRTSGEDR